MLQTISGGKEESLSHQFMHCFPTFSVSLHSPYLHIWSCDFVSSIWTRLFRLKRKAPPCLWRTCRWSQRVSRRLISTKINRYNWRLIMSSLASVLYAMKEDSEKVPVLLTDYILKGKYYFFLPCLSKVSNTKTVSSVWVDLCPLLSSPLSHLKSHLTTRPSWFADVPSISPPRLVSRPSCMIFNMDPHPPHHRTHPDSWLLPFAELTFNHQTKHVWPQPRWWPREEFCKCVTFKRDFTTGAWCTGTYQGNSIVAFLPSFSSLFLRLTVNWTLNLWPRFNSSKIAISSQSNSKSHAILSANVLQRCSSAAVVL